MTPAGCCGQELRLGARGRSGASAKMAEVTSQYWDELYGQERYAYGTLPNEYLVQQAVWLEAGMRALAVADGEGRNAVWMASRGLDVVTIDYSNAGIEKTRKLAEQAGVQLSVIHADVFDWAWPQQAFDVVISIYFHLGPEHRRAAHRLIGSTLKPGGILILEAFHQRHAQRAGSAAAKLAPFLYTVELLQEDFCGLEVLECFEGPLPLAEGYMHQGTADIIRLLARKPRLPVAAVT